MSHTGQRGRKLSLSQSLFEKSGIALCLQSSSMLQPRIRYAGFTGILPAAVMNSLRTDVCFTFPLVRLLRLIFVVAASGNVVNHGDKAGCPLLSLILSTR